MKKIIILLMIIALLFNNIVFVYAQNDEALITRAEFARSIFGLLTWSYGMGPISKSVLIDVPHEHWASAYIYPLYDYDIIRGNGDGIFRPDNEILIEEAIALLIRSIGGIGYIAWRGGHFPLTYLEVAEEIGLTKDIDFIVGQYVNRELFHSLVNKALDVSMLIHFPFIHTSPNDDRQLSTLRIHAWNNLPVYFNGWEFDVRQTDDDGYCIEFLDECPVCS